MCIRDRSSVAVQDHADCGKALREFPSTFPSRSLAVTFVAAPRVAKQDSARKAVSKIAKLLLDRKRFEEQGSYSTTQYTQMQFTTVRS